MIPILMAIVQQVCGARGPRPRYPRVWNTRKKIGTISIFQVTEACRMCEALERFSVEKLIVFVYSCASP